jgi:negative regulator of flagellin synthesis FlgM
MTIDRLGPVDPLQNAKKSSRPEHPSKPDSSDSVSLSSEAVEKGESYKAYEIARAAPDVRADKIAELKGKIDDPAYIDDAVLSLTADRIIEQLIG